jgi:WD40 repeat protein
LRHTAGSGQRFAQAEPFTGHTSGVWAVAVGELDGRPIVVSGSLDSTVRVSDLATGGNPRVIRLDVVVLSVTKPKNNLVVLALLGRGEVHNEIKLRVMPW